MTAERSVVESARRLVVKVGSSLVTIDGRGIDRDAVARWAEQVAALRRAGKEVVLERTPRGDPRAAGRCRGGPDGTRAGL